MLYFTDIQISLPPAIHSNDIFNRDGWMIFHILNKMGTNALKVTPCQTSSDLHRIRCWNYTAYCSNISYWYQQFFLYLGYCLRTEIWFWLTSRCKDLRSLNYDTLSIISCIVNLNTDVKLWRGFSFHKFSILPPYYFFPLSFNICTLHLGDRFDLASPFTLVFLLITVSELFDKHISGTEVIVNQVTSLILTFATAFLSAVPNSNWNCW